jgi:dolichyl-phosphate-mannose--protein O-mannosyl transferase
VVNVARTVAPSPPFRAPERVSTRLVGWTLGDTIALTVITLVAGGLRVFRVTTPSRLIFDEGYYAIQACEYVFGNGPPCHAEAGLPMTGVHPPLGTWLIAGGIKIFGFRSGGWRVASLAAGTLTVVLVFLLARRLLRSTLAATIASGALAFDALHFIHSRVAMLDVFVTFFVVAAVLAAVYDGDRPALLPRRDGRGTALGQRIRERRWRFAAGAGLGAAVACKWSGFPFFFLVVGLIVAAEWRRRPLGRRSLLPVIQQEGPSLALAFGLIPVIVYVGSYIGRIDGAILALPWSRGSWAWAFLAHQRDMLAFHLGLDLPHHYASPAWSWPLMKRPPIYWLEVNGGKYQEIIAIGNPMIWWGGLASLGYVAYRWVRRHREDGEAIVLLAVAAGWLPWLILAPARPTVYSFYLLVCVPFLCLALGYVARAFSATALGRAGIATFAAASIGMFAFFYPILAAVPINEDAWRVRILFEDCELEGLRLTQMELPAGVVSPTDTPGPYPEAQLRRGPPPPGWCWI